MINRTPSLSVTIDEVQLTHTSSDLIQAVSVDNPKAGKTARAIDLTISGWVLPQDKRPLLSIEVNVDGLHLKRLPLNIARPDVIEHFQLPDQRKVNCGFHANIGLLGLPENFHFELVAVFKGDDAKSRVKVPFAKITGRKTTKLKSKTKYQPLMLTAIGRSGTTWAMKLLSQHPSIATSNFYPHEIKQSEYWMQMLKVLTDPADFASSSHPDNFEVTMGSIGHNPYTHEHYLNQYNNSADFYDHYSEGVVRQTKDFVVQQIDAFYDLVAKSENKPRAKYFTEKMLPCHLQSMYYDVYQEPKEIILVRDFRDVLCSAKSFNEKRNTVSFGRERVSDDIQWVEHVSKAGTMRMANALAERGGNAFLLKYEDLILEPAKVLKDLFDYAEIDASEKTVASVIAAANETNSSMDAHKTTKNPADSIGRWKKDMSEEMKAACKREMGHILGAFGYEM
ncbi:sulfotransferase [Aestuariibacter halophilus]|uniref:Sulfotransferase n=1 Tax=Fluctibacter halophilus TaxID=226011 RepID=A0ABS8GBU3_9ALTE|nr:sulfotransferase [Aestuariibacter halophilus]MCC2617229.1 sulfotransferase [Aestuariibacter halophilus]